MTFVNDVFISYAHLDNKSLSPGDEGWVSDFHEALLNRLGEVWGREPTIWRDPKLQGNDDFSAELGQRFRGAKVLVSILTPRYLASDWCQRELDGFWEAAALTGGALRGTKSRVFKVVKTPVPLERIPALVQPLLGYEFYRLQAGTERPLEFNKVYGPEAVQDFWVRLNDLAYDLAALLSQMESDDSATTSKATVYLASTTSDQQPQHDALRRDLLRHGYRVLPEEQLPLLADGLTAAVTHLLGESDVSIHLVGSAYGIVPEDSEVSLPELQAQLAGAQARDHGLARLVWIAPGISMTDARQRRFSDTLRNDPAPGTASDLLETPFEELKTVAFARLKAAEEPPPPAPTPSVDPDAPKRVYVVCDAKDAESVLPLNQILFDEGFDILPAVFDGSETELREYHDAQLRDCDAILIYHGTGSQLWLNEKLGDLRRAAALRTRPLVARGVCLAPPMTPAKQGLLTRDAIVVRLGDAITPAALQAFTTLLRAATATS